MIRPLLTHVNNNAKIYVAIPTTGSYSTFSEVVSLYPSAEKISSNIETVFNVPTTGSASVDICYTSKTGFLREDILVDTTNSSSFWNDIENWMFLNNFVGIVQSGSVFYVDDNTNSSLLYIRNNG